MLAYYIQVFDSSANFHISCNWLGKWQIYGGCARCPQMVRKNFAVHAPLKAENSTKLHLM